jgi:hypothetical protein
VRVELLKRERDYAQRHHVLRVLVWPQTLDALQTYTGL